MSYTFSSKLAPSIITFINYKHNLGYKYNSGTRALSELDRYCIKHSLGSELTREMVEGWIIDKEERNPSVYRAWISPIRELGRFLRVSGAPQAYVVSSHFTSKRYRPTPYLLSEREIRSFFEACSAIPPTKKSPGRHLVLPAIFTLMYCCGLRSVEARTLPMGSVSLEYGYIDIIASKGHRDRRVFLRDDLCGQLSQYDRGIGLIFPDRKYFFPTGPDTCCSAGLIGIYFNLAWDTAGLQRPQGKQPRAYDFRHHFAFSNINRWTSAGKNVNTLIPYLMAYMGHGSINSTLYYVHLAPDFFTEFERISDGLSDIIPEVENEQR